MEYASAASVYRTPQFSSRCDARSDLESKHVIVHDVGYHNSKTSKLGVVREQRNGDLLRHITYEQHRRRHVKLHVLYTLFA